MSDNFEPEDISCIMCGEDASYSSSGICINCRQQLGSGIKQETFRTDDIKVVIQTEPKCNSECGMRMKYPFSCEKHDCKYLTEEHCHVCAGHSVMGGSCSHCNNTGKEPIKIMTDYEKWEEEREPLGMDLPLRDIREGVSEIIKVIEIKLPEAFEAGKNVLQQQLNKLEYENDILLGKISILEEKICYLQRETP